MQKTVFLSDVLPQCSDVSAWTWTWTWTLLKHRNLVLGLVLVLGLESQVLGLGLGLGTQVFVNNTAAMTIVTSLVNC